MKSQCNVLENNPTIKFYKSSFHSEITEYYVHCDIQCAIVYTFCMTETTHGGVEFS